MRYYVFAFAFIASVLLVRPWPYLYEGDGVFAQSGWSRFFNVYELDLGSVDLSRTGSYVYKVGELPLKKFSFGFFFVADSGFDLSVLNEVKVSVGVYGRGSDRLYSFEGSLYDPHTANSAFFVEASTFDGKGLYRVINLDYHFDEYVDVMGFGVCCPMARTIVLKILEPLPNKVVLNTSVFVASESLL